MLITFPPCPWRCDMCMAVESARQLTQTVPTGLTAQTRAGVQPVAHSSSAVCVLPCAGIGSDAHAQHRCTLSCWDSQRQAAAA